MGWIKGTIFCFFIPFLTIYWAYGVSAVPDSSLPGSGDCSSKYSSSGPPLIYVNPIRNPPKTGYCPTEKRQQLINQASILLKKLSPNKVGTSLDIPSIVDLESVVIQNLVNCLGALDEKNTAVTTPSKNPVVISKATYNYIVNQYRKLRILVSDCLPEKNANKVLSALDDLYDTFKKIINGKLLNVELSNLCSKILALNAQLEATEAPKNVRAGVTDFIKSLTSALTGQSQVTITAICKCLNELETSVVKIVQDGKAEKLQDLLSSLINAMINAVVSADDGCDVVEIVQNYVVSINEAIKQDAESRAKNIYGSVLNFEKHLSKVLIGSGSTDNKNNSSVPVITGSSKDPGSVSDPSKDASAIVVNGTLFIIKEHVVELIDDDENIVEVKRNGSYHLVDPKREISWTGNYAVQQGTIVSDPDGSVTIVNSGFYDVILRNDNSKNSKRQGVFNLQDNIVVKKDKYGYPERTEYGTYALTDSLTGSARTGRFVVTNTISQRNPDRSIDITKAGILFVDDPHSVPSSAEPPSEAYDEYFLNEAYISNSTSKNVNHGSGIFNIKNSKTLGAEDGSYTIRNFDVNLNANGSVDFQTTGVFHRDSYTIKVKGYHPVPVISKGSHFVSHEHVDPPADKYDYFGLIRIGKLTQTDPKTGIKTSKSYVVFNTIYIVNPDGSSYITKFGRFITADENPSTTVSTTKNQSSSDPTDTARPLLVSKKSFEALLAGLKPVPSNQSPKPQVQPVVHEKTDPHKKPPVLGNTELCDDDTEIVLHKEYNVTSIAANGTFFIINEFITPLLDSNGNVLTLIKMGTFWFRDEKTNISWSGAFEATEYSEQTNSPNKMNTTKAGTLEVNPGDHGVCAPDVAQVNGFFTLNGYVVTGKNGAITITENGTYYLLDTATSDTKTGRFVVLNNYTKLLDDGVIEIVKTGILFDDPNSKSPSKEISLSGTGRYFIFDDRSSTDPKTDGNNGTGVYSMKDSTTNEQISGIYVINERTITENSDGTVDLKTVGVIYINGSGFSDTSSKSGSIPSVRTGSTFTSTDHLVTVTDAKGHTSTFGTGTYSQTDPVTGEIQSAIYEVKNVVTLTGDDGSTSTLKLGRIPNDGYTYGSKVSSTSKTIPADDTVYCFFQDHVSMKPGSKGNSGTGDYKIDYPAKKEFSVGTYDILKRSSVVNSDGSTTWKTSGIIHFNSTASSPSSSDTRLAILDGAQFTTEDCIFYSRDPNNNVIAIGTGIFTQIIPSTGLIISTKYTIKEFIINWNSDGGQDIKKSGTIDELPVIDVINKSDNPSNSDPVLKDTIIVDPNYDQVYVSFEDHLYSPSEVDGSYGVGNYKLENPSREEVVVGNYVIQERSITAKSDGTTQIKKSGVIYVDNSQSSSTNSDSRLAVLDGAVFTLEEYVSIIKDENDNFIVTGTGLLTQSDSKLGVVTFTNYTITYFSTVNNRDGSQDIVTSGTLLYTAAIAGGSSSIEPQKSSDPQSKPLQTITEQDERVSFLFTDLLLGTAFPDGTLGTGMFRVENQVRGEFVAGSYDIFERNTITSSNGTVYIKTSGVIHLDSSNSSPIITDERLTFYDGAECVFEEYVQSRNGVNGISSTGNGKLTQTDRNAALITTTTYAIESYRIDYKSDKSKVITRSGTIQDSSTLAYLSTSKPLKSSDPQSKPLQTITEQDETVSFSFTDLLLGTPFPDGTLGTGMFRVENQVTGEFVTGSYAIFERNTITSSNGTVYIKTSGVIHVDSSNSSPIITDTRLTFYDGAECVFEEYVQSRNGVNGISSTGNGKLTQTDRNAALITITTYAIESYRIDYKSDKSKVITRSGTIQDSSTLAYLSTSKPLKNSDPQSKPLQTITEQDETVSFSFTDLLLGTPFPDGTLGTGMFRVENQVTGEFVTGSYDIFERNTITSSNGTVYIKTSGVIHVDSSNSSPIITDTRLTFYDGAECVFEEYVQSRNGVNGFSSTSNGKLTQTDRNAALITITTYAIESYRIDYKSDKSKVITRSGTIQDSSTLAYLSSGKILSDSEPLTSPLKSKATVASVCVTLPRADVVAANGGNNPKPGNVVIIKTNDGKVLSAKVKDNQSPLTFNLINLAQFSDIYASGSAVWNIAENNFSAQNRKLIDAVARTQPC